MSEIEFKKRISKIFLTSIKQNVDFDFFIERIIEWIAEQKTDLDWYNWLVDEQQSLFLKIIHIYSITIFETFNQDFFKAIDKVKTLPNKNVTTTPKKILKFFQNNFQINLEREFNLWDVLKESICRRNVIIHKMGRIDKIYQDCINSKLDILDKMIGSNIPHDINYVKLSNHNIAHYTIFTFKKVTQFYNLTDIDSIIKKLAEHPHYHDVNPNLLNDEGYFFQYRIEIKDEDKD
ncbi:MAG: hypothetical protein ACFE75_02590 [Candidatus Hodarchaeota archaeon]